MQEEKVIQFKIHMTMENKKRVLWKMSALSMNGFNNKSDESIRRKSDCSTGPGIAYFFESMITQGKSFVGWSCDYSDDPEEYYDRKGEYVDVPEKVFLRDDFRYPETVIQIRDKTYHSTKATKEADEKIKEHKQRCDAMNVSPHSSVSAIRNLYEDFNRKQKQSIKEQNMKPTTVEVKIDGVAVCNTTTAEPEIESTDLENAPKWVTQWYNDEGNFLFTNNISPKKAKKQLQNPDYLGYTFRSYKIHASATTSIPVKDVEV